MTNHMPSVITIDGPSGVGKGTTAKQVAATLGWHFLDSGALYRILAFACARRQVDLEDIEAVILVARTMAVEFDFNRDGVDAILLDDTDVASDIRTEAVAAGASVVAASGAIRQVLLQRQRDFAMHPGLVADGRDMGTVVFPEAGCKIFLTATAEERAIRRHRQLKESGNGVSLRALLAEIKARDERDASRTVAPLKPADDAVVIDTTHLSVREVVAQVLELAHQRFDLN